MHGHNNIPMLVPQCLHFSSSNKKKKQTHFMEKAVTSFNPRSAAGPDKISQQHLKELLSRQTGEAGARLLQSLTSLANMTLAGDVPHYVLPLFMVQSHSTQQACWRCMTYCSQKHIPYNDGQNYHIIIGGRDWEKTSSSTIGLRYPRWL